MQQAVVEGYKNKLKNRFFGALCEREKKGNNNDNWKKCIDSIHVELLGWEQEEGECIYLFQLLKKVGALKLLNYEKYRKTIFECMELVDLIGKE